MPNERPQSFDAPYESIAEADASPVAVSTDARAGREKSRHDYGPGRLPVGSDTPIDVARQMGVFVSTGTNDGEMPLYCRPASFRINAGNRIQAAWIASNAYARARMEDGRIYFDFLYDHADGAPRGSA